MMSCHGLTRVLSCSVCNSPYSDPLQLQCSHVFCGCCLLDIKNHRAPLGNEIACPDCKKVTHLGNKGISGLTPNVALSSMASKLRAYQAEEILRKGTGMSRSMKRNQKDEDLGFVIGHNGGCFIVQPKKARLDITAETIPSNSETATVRISWSTKATRVMFFEVKCETQVERGDLMFEEKVSTHVGDTMSVEFCGLRYSQKYTVTVEGQTELGEEVMGKLTFTTQPPIQCKPITLDVNDSHPAVTLMGNYDFVAHNVHNNNVREDNVLGGDQFWQKTVGIGSYYCYDEENLYWEVLVDLNVHAKWKTEVSLATIGICKANRGDIFSPLERNFDSYTCTLFKRSGSRCLGISMSNGMDTNLMNIDLFNLKNSYMEVRLGFFLDFDRNVFKIFWRKDNGDDKLYTFENMTVKPVVLVCELLNEEKSNTGIKFISGGDISSLPPTLYKADRPVV